jgi:hypothetical protein
LHSPLSCLGGVGGFLSWLVVLLIEFLIAIILPIILLIMFLKKKYWAPVDVIFTPNVDLTPL